ncbi:SpoIIIAH-like family protein [bacterium D16-51]|nr:SpoIIIAH-like family protein [bacterium D16-59]RKI54929.1 SpoIIIAH-like family protein [bacterium D16-51]
MKKVVRKNQIIVTALAIMIVVAGYLNFTGQEISTSGLVSSQNKEQAAKKTSDGKKDSVETSADSKEKEDKKDTKTDISAEDEGSDDYTVNEDGEVVASKENPGEAVMVSNSLSGDYFSSAKLSREQNRAKNKSTLMEIINNKSVASADKKAAVKEVAAITAAAEKENAAELMLEAKGFSDAMVSISEGNADVVVSAKELSNQQIAQIEDIVKRKTGIAAQKIVITPVAVEE